MKEEKSFDSVLSSEVWVNFGVPEVMEALNSVSNELFLRIEKNYESFQKQAEENTEIWKAFLTNFEKIQILLQNFHIKQEIDFTQS